MGYHRRRLFLSFAVRLIAVSRLLATASLLTAAAQAAAPVINASLDPTQIAMGDTAQLTITSSGNGLDNVQLPQVAGLELRVIGQSRRVQIINGAMLDSISVLVRVTPQAPGIYTIPGVTPAAQPLVLRVNPEGTAPPAGPSRGLGLGAPGTSSGANAGGVHLTQDGSAFARLVLPKRDIYVGESIPVDIEVGMRDGFVSSLNGLPTLTGGDFTLNNLSHQPERVERVIEGKPYTVLTWHSVIAAVKSGKFSLAAQTPLTVRVRTNSARDSRIDDLLGDPFMQNFFGATVSKDINVASPPTDLTVLELPSEGRPANFSGAVGEFKIASDLSAHRAAAGDPLTLRLHVTGTGNFDRVDTSMLSHLDHWKTYPPKSSFKPSDPLGNQGDKTFEQPLIATEPGQQMLPPLTFSYFDPAARRYQTASSTPLEVTIAPSLADSNSGVSTSATPRTAGNGPAQAPATASRDGLREDHADLAARPRSLVPLYLEPPFLAIPSLLALLLAGGWLLQVRRGTTQAALRARTDSRALERRLSHLETAARTGRVAEFFSIARTLLPPAPPLRDGTPDDSAHDDVRRLYALADEAQYSGEPPSATDLHRWVAVVRTLATARSPTRSTPLFILAALCVLACLPGPGRAADANRAYSAAALYNEGNAQARAGHIGLAVLAYQRARLLTPDDPDLEANLSHVRATAKLPASPRSTLDAALLVVSPTVAASLGLAGLLLAGASLLWVRRTAVRRSGLALGVLLVAATVGQAAVLWPELHSAVILTPSTPARATPVPMGDPLFVLAEGDTVVVSAVHDEFVLVKSAQGPRGWVASANLARIVPGRTGAGITR